MLKDYMDLQILRMKFPFRYNFKIAEDLDQDDIMVPPAIFQPVIENSIEHNFNRKNATGEIVIDVRLENDDLIFSIEDSCSGETRSTAIAEGSEQKKVSFGENIVRERLKLYGRNGMAFGEMKRFPQENGMKVIIVMPQ